MLRIYRKFISLGLSTLVVGVTVLGFNKSNPVAAQNECPTVRVSLGGRGQLGSEGIKVYPLIHEGTGNYGMGGTVNIRINANLRRYGNEYIQVYGRVRLSEAPGHGKTAYSNKFSNNLYVNQLINLPRTRDGKPCYFSRFAQTRGYVQATVPKSQKHRISDFPGTGIIKNATCLYNARGNDDRGKLFCDIYFQPAILYFGR